jgi:hypothetical protein
VPTFIPRCQVFLKPTCGSKSLRADVAGHEHFQLSCASRFPFSTFPFSTRGGEFPNRATGDALLSIGECAAVETDGLVRCSREQVPPPHENPRCDHVNQVTTAGAQAV